MSLFCGIIGCSCKYLRRQPKPALILINYPLVATMVHIEKVKP